MTVRGENLLVEGAVDLLAEGGGSTERIGGRLGRVKGRSDDGGSGAMG